MCLASNEDRPIRRTCPASESGAGVGPVFPDEFGFAGERAGAVFRNRVGDAFQPLACGKVLRSEEHTSELQSLMRISSAVFCLQINNEKSRLVTESRTKDQKNADPTHTHIYRVYS